MSDPRVEAYADHICHVVAENESIERLNDKSRSDIFLTSRAIADINKKTYEDARLDQWLYKELKIWIREKKDLTRDDLLQILLHQELEGKNRGIRDIWPVKR